jgi:preprotein translocase subunit SecD
MNRRRTSYFIMILVLVALALWIDLSKEITITNPFNKTTMVSRNVETRLGLDMRGGLQVLLEADVPADTPVSADDLKTVRQILESRTNALGVSEVVMQTAGDRRIVAEFPGIDNPEEVVASLQQTALLEFIDTGTQALSPGTIVKTDFAATSGEQPSATPTPSATATPEANATPAADATPQPSETVYHTIMTGAALKNVSVTTDQVGNYQISFELDSDAAKTFADFTSSHINQYLTIVLDKKVISSPRINSAIPNGSGVITGDYTYDSANTFAIQLRYGSLPIPMKVVESRTVGPTLGEESVRKSILAGSIGLIVVMLFMGLYYRLPGVVADLALLTYSLFSLALFKLIPVVLTLPGIAGFVLSIGMAVDANVLIFERLKEELRAGRNLRQAIDLGWSRAWPSIRDANIATLITCTILYIFGNTFGASMVKGFSITLALGVVVSLFTAINVTRTFLHLVLDNVKSAEHPRWFGL